MIHRIYLTKALRDRDARLLTKEGRRVSTEDVPNQIVPVNRVQDYDGQDWPPNQYFDMLYTVSVS